MFYILPLGVSGLTMEDLRLHLYLTTSGAGGDTAEIDLPSTLTVTEDAQSHYKIDNLPTGAPASRYTLTAEYPEDVGHSFVWGGTGTPSGAVIPVRETGLDTPDLDLIVYRNGTVQALSLTADQMTGDGDYLISGWPVASTGASWLLLWSRGGVTSWYSWTESTALSPVLPQPSGWLAQILRVGVGIADTITNGGGIQPWIVHEAWIGSGESGDVYADPVQVRAVVDRTNKQSMRGTTILFVSATLTFTTSPERALTSGGVPVDTSTIFPPRSGPIDAKDKLTLPDGWTAQVIDIPEGVIDPGTGRGFAPVVMLGSEQSIV